MSVRRQLHRFAGRYAASVERRSRMLVEKLPRVVEAALPWWIAIFMAIAFAKIARSLTPVHDIFQFADLFIPYALIALAPALAWRLGKAAYERAENYPLPEFRLAHVGQWRQLARHEARAHPHFGPAGFMAMLLTGLLLNVVIRSLEYFYAVPALSSEAPDWGRAIFIAMSFDVMAMNFIYVTCFVMALRSIPLFPRMLGFAWLMDIALQLGIAKYVAAQPNLPVDVAQSLVTLLDGNITKVLISAFIWLPYLLLSSRANVTFRSRAPA